jgi:hypothetical protein
MKKMTEYEANRLPCARFLSFLSNLQLENLEHFVPADSIGTNENLAQVGEILEEIGQYCA